MQKEKVKESIKRAAKGLWSAFPMILGTLLLISLLLALIPKAVYLSIFTNNQLIDPLIGSLIGSVSAGNPLVSYILGGELLKQGVSLIAVTAFIVAWVTIGIAQFPAESMILGKKFAMFRNISAFILAILVAILTVIVLGVI
jgi:uncharacterized membrane protein YraQ (UPF0718 family)